MNMLWWRFTPRNPSSPSDIRKGTQPAHWPPESGLIYALTNWKNPGYPCHSGIFAIPFQKDASADIAALDPTNKICSAEKITLSMKIKINGKNPILVGLISLVLGLGILIYGVKDVLNAKQSAGWSKVKGEILESRLSEKRRGEKGKLRSKKAVISYRYTVDEIAYTSDRPIFGATGDLTAVVGLTRSEQELIRKYPKGKSVEVFHHPDKPELAVLEAGFNKEALVPVFFGLFFSFAGGIVIRRGIKAQ